MREDYTILAVFEYSTEAQLVKSKLNSEGIKTISVVKPSNWWCKIVSS